MTTYSYAAIPLYLAQIEGGQFKLGINISLGGSSTKRLYEFDTGAAGFYPAAIITETNSKGTTEIVSWWSDFIKNKTINSFDQTYSSNIQYTALSTCTCLSFEGNVYGADGVLAVSWPAIDVAVGAILAATKTTQTPNSEGYTKFTIAWNKSLTEAEKDLSHPGPLDGVFFGDFGIGLGNAKNSGPNEGDAVTAVFPQLPSPLSDVFTIVTNGTPTVDDIKNIQENGHIPWGYVFLGKPPENVLRDAGVPGKFVFTKMVANAEPTPYPNNSNLTSFAQGAVNALSCSFKPSGEPIIDVGHVNLVLDTGCPGIVVHYNENGAPIILSDTLNGQDISEIVDVDNNKNSVIKNGVEFDLKITPDLPFGGQASVGYHLTVSADSPIGAKVNSNTNTPEASGYINTGFDIFLKNAVQFNLATGQIGFAALPTNLTSADSAAATD